MENEDLTIAIKRIAKNDEIRNELNAEYRYFFHFIIGRMDLDINKLNIHVKEYNMNNPNSPKIKEFKEN